jgi:hypothetical protein
MCKVRLSSRNRDLFDVTTLRKNHDVRPDNGNLIALTNEVYVYPKPDNVPAFFTETEGNSLSIVPWAENWRNTKCNFSA